MIKSTSSGKELLETGPSSKAWGTKFERQSSRQLSFLWNRNYIPYNLLLVPACANPSLERGDI
ncbi:unnamed protein product [Prunus armeniaca]|uniref:Uncharacterized protein n=1 Tax=Prunus armeniaca TaxID=36596 RepID=A0A6J5UZH6_PRUAR|nr:unnamed protein product [Prunus armeniaca]CAB4311757.1 unnamed protein product [Prunus armeniaca]